MSQVPILMLSVLGTAIVIYSIQMYRQEPSQLKSAVVHQELTKDELPEPTQSSESSPTIVPSPSPTVIHATVNIRTSQEDQPTSLPSSSSPLPSPKEHKEEPAQEPAIEILSVPTHVSAGQSFTVSWKVVGASGTKGEDAKLSSTHVYKSENNGSSINSSTKNSQGYGSFTTPHIFSSNFSFDAPGGNIEFTASATVNGKHLERTFTVEIEG